MRDQRSNKVGDSGMNFPISVLPDGCNTRKIGVDL